MSPVAAPSDPTISGKNTSCPDCGAAMAADQLYCLDCGHRRGEARPPLTDPRGGAGRIPPPPPSTPTDPSRRWGQNAALIVGVAALLLAIGIGFLVGRAIYEGGSSASHGTEHITIEYAGEAPTATPEGSPGSQGAESGIHPGKGSGGETPEGSTPSKARSGSEETPKQEAEAEQKLKEELHAKGPLPKSKAQVGESCVKGTPGCGKDKKFNGEFFGGEE
jgi:hypothetical protein